MLLLTVAAAAVLALASPAPAPRPTPTNPFNLDPIPQSSDLPVIGRTRAKPVCTAIRRAVAPGVAAAMKNDRTFAGLRHSIFDYVVKDSEDARDLHLMQMDRTVDAMVKDVETLEDALKSPALDVPATAKPEDAQTLRSLRSGLAGILGAEKTQLNVMSGFVETERMRRFGKLSESEQNMQRANNPNVSSSNGGLVTPAPMGGFLRDTQDTFNPQHRTPNSLNDAHLLDRDLGEIVATTDKYEDAASKVIIAAANSCK